MKKVSLLMVFVFTTILAISCSSDNDGGSTSNSDIIVGNWKNVGVLVDGFYEEFDNEPCDDVFYKYNGNGKGKITEKYCGEAADIINFTWEKGSGEYYYLTNEYEEGGLIKITFSEDKKTMQMYSVEGSDNAAVFERQ